MSEYRTAERQVEVSVGESVRILRELQGLSQNQLAEISGIPQSTISAIENDRIQLGVERAKTLAKRGDRGQGRGARERTGACE
ncbi:MAG: helix-turn-helix transcriptional regulator [Blastocatellia bacterium]|jgi:transcriptional regulator with XRE-family HTH domain